MTVIIRSNGFIRRKVIGAFVASKFKWFFVVVLHELDFQTKALLNQE